MEAPQKIVSLVPSKTELLFDLGLSDRVVGVTKFCIHPENGVSGKPKIGGTKKLHLEKIAALEPDMIIANREENRKEEVEWLANRFPVYTSEIYSVDQALTMIADIGTLCGVRSKALELISEISQERLVYKVANGSSGTACYLIWKDPYMVAAADTYIHSMLTEGGWENVFADDYSRYPVVEISDIVSYSPQYVFLSSEPYPFQSKHLKELRELCGNSGIKLVDGEMFSWYGSRMRKAFAYFDRLRNDSY